MLIIVPRRVRFASHTMFVFCIFTRDQQWIRFVANLIANCLCYLINTRYNLTNTNFTSDHVLFHPKKKNCVSAHTQISYIYKSFFFWFIVINDLLSSAKMYFVTSDGEEGKRGNCVFFPRIFCSFSLKHSRRYNISDRTVPYTGKYRKILVLLFKYKQFPPLRTATTTK